MIFGGESFFFEISKKMTALFGNIFSDITIKRYDDTGKETALIKVPLSYSAKDKMLQVIRDDPELNRPYSALLPRMAFELVDMIPDRGRHLPTVNRQVKQVVGDPNNMKFQYTPVPYNIKFNLYVYVKNAEDGYRIIEQILPFFTPDWTPLVQLVPEMDELRDIPFIHDSLSIEDTFAGDPKDHRVIVYSLGFTCKTYFYGPVKTKPIIKFTEVRAVLGTADTSNAYAYANEIVTLQPGLLANGSPTTNAAASVPYTTININDKWDYAFTDTEKT